MTRWKCTGENVVPDLQHFLRIFFRLFFWASFWGKFLRNRVAPIAMPVRTLHAPCTQMFGSDILLEHAFLQDV